MSVSYYMHINIVMKSAAADKAMYVLFSDV